jgi:hypothetical protein
MTKQPALQRPSSQKQKGENQTGGNRADGWRSSPAWFGNASRGARTIASCVALVVLGVASTATAAPRSVARTAHTLTANDEGKLEQVGESGQDIIEEGKVTGTIPGKVRAWFLLEATIRVRFVLYPNGGGSISGHGWGKPSSSGKEASFGGKMSITSGTGRYRHAHGEGGFFGKILRHEPYPVTVQTRGTLAF